MSTLEAIRFQYTSDRDADQAKEAQSESMVEYKMRFADWSSEKCFQEAQRLYGLGVQLGNMLFASSFAETPDEFPGRDDMKKVDLPTIGSFLLRRDNSQEQDAGLAYFLNTYTATGMNAEEGSTASIRPEFVELSKIQGGRVMVAQLAYGFDVFDALRAEAGLPRVVQPLHIVK